MGMAASQARYLALVARKSNCEFEGQQINQARTALSNQSANLFNQMLGLKVPVPPSTQDFTKVQYSFKDGANTSTISDWEQLSSADPDYNYVVTHYYYTDQYTGSQKLMNDPQVQFTASTATSAQISALRTEVAAAEQELANAKEANATAKKDYEDAVAALNAKETEASNIENHSAVVDVTAASYSDADDEFVVTTADGDVTYLSYENLTEAEKASADAMIANLISLRALPANCATDKTGLYFTNAGASFAYQSDLSNLVTTGSGELKSYGDSKVATYNAEIASLDALKNLSETTYTGTTARLEVAESEYNTAVEAYESLQHPEYIGNSELTPIASLSKEQEAEIRQIVSDMEEEGITSEIINYFDPESGAYNGGIYSFKMGGKTYFTTYADLEASYNSGTGINNIDGQNKLAYYNATYVSTKVEKTEKALLETDGAGRFTSVRFEDDSITYTLTTETVTDEAAYQDAMNQYYYENAKYDKMVQDINAKTSIIHHEDQQLELRLKQLDTEQSALSTEMEAVKKVVDDNIDSSFKTFGG